MTLLDLLLSSLARLLQQIMVERYELVGSHRKSSWAKTTCNSGRVKQAVEAQKEERGLSRKILVRLERGNGLEKALGKMAKKVTGE